MASQRPGKMVILRAQGYACPGQSRGASFQHIDYYRLTSLFGGRLT